VTPARALEIVRLTDEELLRVDRRELLELAEAFAQEVSRLIVAMRLLRDLEK